MLWLQLSLLVLSAYVADQVHADKVCEHEIGEYYKCLEAVNKKAEVAERNVDKICEKVDACFAENKCVPPMKQSSFQDTLMGMIQPCLEGLEKNTNVVQDKCLAKHNPGAAPFAKHVFVGENQGDDYTSELDDVLYDRTGQIYQMKALEALHSLHELEANQTTCTVAGRAKVKSCLVDVFGSVKKYEEQPNVFLREIESESKYNAYCKEHKACINKLSKKCHEQLGENKDSFCHCMQYHFQSRLLKDFQKCSGATTVSLATPVICEVVPNEESCKRSYLEAKLNVIDIDQQPGAGPAERRKRRSAAHAELNRPVSLRFYHRA